MKASFDSLRMKLESAAFLVTQGGASREAHAEIVKGLVILAELENCFTHSASTSASTETPVEEINKVCRRLKLWARRPDSVNARILKAYLKLQRANPEKVITESDVKNELPDVTKFESNFMQMRIIADKNHGKVFDIKGSSVLLWPPVEPAIREFERFVFKQHE